MCGHFFWHSDAAMQHSSFILSSPSGRESAFPERAQSATAPANQRRTPAGFTLVEVMIAATIFLMTAMSIGALFVQNNKMSMRLRYRTNATNAALNILEQIRVLDFTSLDTLYTKSATESGAFIRVLIGDPNAPDHSAVAAPDPTGTPPALAPGFGADTIPLKYENLDLVINVRDGVIVPPLNSTWNTFSVPLTNSTSPTARMPMRYWLTLKYNTAISGDATIVATGQAFEIVLVYQWQQPGTPASSPWESATVRAVVQNQSPLTVGS